MILEKSNIHLLVVDDELGMRDMLSVELGEQGYQVVTACNGQEAMEHAKNQKFDLVITDLKMPQMNGIDLLENIKGIQSELEVIVATGHGTIEAAVMAMKNGAYDFILKPYNLYELNALIEKALEKKKLKTMVALYEASNAIFSTLSLDKVLEIIMDMLEKVLRADESSLMLLNGQRKLVISASRGLSDQTAREVQIEIGERVAGVVAKEKKARLLINGLEKYPEFKNIKSKTRVKSSIICPLLCQGELLGVLNLSRTKNVCNFTETDLHSATVFASQAALAIQNAKLYRDLENAQTQLVQSEKLASIGRLVAGVAHELNNPLTAVIGYSQLAVESQDLREIHRQLPIIASQAQRCGRIVKDLLLFSRRQKPNYEKVDPCILIEDLLKLMALEFGKRKVSIKEYFPAEPVFLQADPHLLKQVFANILTNAYQSLEEISTDRLIEVKVEKADENLQISFKDNGAGIPRAIIHKIFDPFYTTKEVGKGTGLGLSLCYGIIKGHEGSIAVKSDPGEGALFTIELPFRIKDGSISTVSDRPRNSQLKLPAGTRILLAEDEAPIRGFILKILEERGYATDVVEDGQTALVKLLEHDYDVILCDYRMPKLDGIKLYEHVKKIKPHLAAKFLFVSGSTEFMRNFDSYSTQNSFACLLKPFTREEFNAAVNSVYASSHEAEVNRYGNA